MSPRGQAPPSAMCPPGRDSPRAGAFDHNHNPTYPRGRQATPGEALPACLTELERRGIVNPDQFAHLDAEAVMGTLRWFDAQHGRVGLGVLVNELRAGGRRDEPVERRQRTRAELAEYEARIHVWLLRWFPDLECEPGRAHVAAVSAVRRLHYRFGRGSLTAGEHGPMIRRAVERFEQRYGVSSDERSAV